MGAENSSFYLEKTPGCYVRIGTRGTDDEYVPLSLRRNRECPEDRGHLLRPGCPGTPSWRAMTTLRLLNDAL